MAYLVSHPIQYQAPLLRRLAREPEINLHVFFCSSISATQFADPEFGRLIEWDVPLLSGYSYEFLPALGRADQLSFWRPLNHGLGRRLKTGRFDFLWIHGYARCYHWAAMVLARRLGIKVLIRDEATGLRGNGRGPRTVAKRGFFWTLDRLCDGFLAIGSLNRDYYLRQGIDEKKIFQVPYAVDNAFFQSKAASAGSERARLRSALALEADRPVILYSGKLVARKRPGDLLEAYVRLSPDGRQDPGAYLLFVGEGELLRSLRQRVDDLGLKSVRFLGFKNQSEIPAYYGLCDFLVLPSVHEPWGLVVNEAMNAGKAVVVSDRVGCAPDLVRDGYNGRIFRAGDVESLCSALRDLLGHPSRCRQMGQRSREIIDGWSFEQDVAGIKTSLVALGNSGWRKEV